MEFAHCKLPGIWYDGKSVTCRLGTLMELNLVADKSLIQVEKGRGVGTSSVELQTACSFPGDFSVIRRGKICTLQTNQGNICQTKTFSSLAATIRLIPLCLIEEPLLGSSL